MLWRKALTYWRSALAIGVIAYGCLIRKPLYTLPPIQDGDKWVHWLAFVALTLVMLWDSKKAGLNRRQIWIVGLAIPVVYGGLIEVLQELFFYPRTGEWSDWLADGVGVFIGAVIWWISQKMACKRNGSIE